MSTNNYWSRWLRAAGVRALKTFAQAFAAALATCSTVFDAPWLPALGTAAMAALLSLLTSVGGLPEVPEVPDVEKGDGDADVR